MFLSEALISYFTILYGTAYALVVILEKYYAIPSPTLIRPRMVAGSSLSRITFGSKPHCLQYSVVFKGSLVESIIRSAKSDNKEC
ncbi:MAG: hypothetical protein H7Y18_18850 [Clostridiaceae bacterium]|nr:hypothetical protein [Clostridiaceae bacterium]